MYELIDINNDNSEDKEFDYKKYIVNPSVINRDIDDFFSGRIKHGYKLGIHILDEYFVVKENELYASTGKKGDGKTTINQVLHLCHSIVNNLIWVVCYKENKDWGMKINMMNYLLQEYTSNIIKNRPELYKKAEKWVDEHFIFIKVDDKKTATMVCEGLVNNGVKVHGLVLDPVNAFDSGWYRTGNKHSDGEDTAKEVQRFVERVCSVHVSQHPTMFGQRKEGDISSFEAEGGYYFNKADYTFSINRDRGTNENRLNIENVRNKHTGGETTDINNQLVVYWHPTKIDVGLQQGEVFEDVIGHLLRKHNPLNIEYPEFKEKKELPIIYPNNAFEDDIPF